MNWSPSRCNDKIPMSEFIAGQKAWAEFLDAMPNGKLHESLLWMGFRLVVAGWRW
jgi:hypothetical protein